MDHFQNLEVGYLALGMLSRSPTRKENSQPIHNKIVGHSAARQPFSSKTVSSQNVKVSSQLETCLSKETAAFEAELERGGPDPAQTWVEYVAWANSKKAENPDFGDRAKTILRRACHKLILDENYRDDVRQLRLWVRHADHVVDAQGIFKNLEHKGIGLKHALLYEAWAAVAEKAHDFEATDGIYQRGLERGAQPLERLQSNYEEYQARQVRRAKRDVKAAARREKEAREAQKQALQAGAGSSKPQEEEPSRQLFHEKPIAPATVLPKDVDGPAAGLVLGGSAPHATAIPKQSERVRPSSLVLGGDPADDFAEQAAASAETGDAVNTSLTSPSTSLLECKSEWIVDSAVGGSICGASPLDMASSLPTEGTPVFGSVRERASLFENKMSELKPVPELRRVEPQVQSTGRDPHSMTFPQKHHFFEYGTVRKSFAEVEEESEYETDDEEVVETPAWNGNWSKWTGAQPQPAMNKSSNDKAQSSSKPAAPVPSLEILEMLAGTSAAASASNADSRARSGSVVSLSSSKAESPRTARSTAMSVGTQDSLPVSPRDRPKLEFGPKDPEKDRASTSSKKKKPAYESKRDYTELRKEDISVEEKKAIWVMSQMQSQPEGATEHQCLQPASSSSAVVTDSLRLPSQASTSGSARRGDDSVASSPATNRAESTQEVTTTCVRDLLREPRRDSRRDSRSSKHSVGGSTAFDEPTYTMNEIQLEVLGMFADSPKQAKPNLQSEHDLPAHTCDGGVCDSPLLHAPSNPAPSSSAGFQIFEEEGFDAPDRAVLANPAPCSGMQVWTDSELDAC